MLTLLTCMATVMFAPGETAAQDAEDPLAEAERHRQELFDRIAPSVVYIAHEDGLGSGFFVDERGIALTNRHVVGERDSVKVVLIDGRKKRAPVIARADELDLALIKVPIRDAPPLQLAGFDDVRIGSWVACIGHGYGGIWTYTTGMISNIYPVEGQRPVFQTQIPVNPGASGGPVFDRQGRVVGIMTAGSVEANSINIAIRSDAAIASFDRLKTPKSTTPRRLHELVIIAPDGAQIFVDQQMVGKGPRANTKVEEGEHRIRVLVGGQMREKNVDIDSKKTVEFPEQ
jgi:S1-C subfamily serine protease